MKTQNTQDVQEQKRRNAIIYCCNKVYDRNLVLWFAGVNTYFPDMAPDNELKALIEKAFDEMCIPATFESWMIPYAKYGWRIDRRRCC